MAGTRITKHSCANSVVLVVQLLLLAPLQLLQQR